MNYADVKAFLAREELLERLVSMRSINETSTNPLDRDILPIEDTLAQLNTLATESLPKE